MRQFLLFCLLGLASQLHAGWLIISDGDLDFSGTINVKDGELELKGVLSSNSNKAIIKIPSENENDLYIFAKDNLVIKGSSINSTSDINVIGLKGLTLTENSFKSPKANYGGATFIQIKELFIPAIKGQFGEESFFHGEPFNAAFLEELLPKN